MNQWHLYDDDDVFSNVFEGTGLAKYARMLLYEYVTEEVYESFLNSTETVVKKWDCFVAKVHKIAELIYFLQKSENDFSGGFTKFKENIREAIEVECFNNKDHSQFFSNETGEINVYGHNAAHALTEACLDGYKGDGDWKGFLLEDSEEFFGIVKQACVGAGGFPVEKSDWVDFFSEKVYPDLLKDVFSKHHEEQNKYFQDDVILKILEKAQQTEKGLVIEEGQGFSDTNIFEEGKKATATTDVSEKDYFAIVATGITMSSKTASENNSPSQLVPTNETVVDKHPTTGAPTAAVQNQPSVPIKTTTVNTADPVLQKERGSVGNTVPGSEEEVVSDTKMTGDNNEEENADASLVNNSSGNDAHPLEPPGTPPNSGSNVGNDKTTMEVDGSSVVLPTSVAGQFLGSVRALGSIFGVSPKKPPTLVPPKNVTYAMDQPPATEGPDSQEVESSVSTNSLVADLISGIQTIAADGKVELLKKLLNDLKSSTESK